MLLELISAPGRRNTGVGQQRVVGAGVGLIGPDPRKVDTSAVSYAAVASVAEVSVSKTSGATKLHHECRRRVHFPGVGPDPVFYYRFTVRNGIADAPH